MIHQRWRVNCLTPFAEHIIDRSSPAQAVSEIRALTGGKLRYAIDCVGKTTAQHAIDALDKATMQKTYIVGLTGLPKEAPANVELCVVVSTIPLLPKLNR